MTKNSIIEKCNASLKRLKTDYVDIFYCLDTNILK
ncbi:MAG: hypothetical protein GX054_02145 [Clostridiales bacterium]|nr:hypothetical protein [Clostridiales bacterium]